MRQREEDQVSLGQVVRVGAGETTAGQGGEMRMDIRDRRARVGRRGDRAQFQVRMTGNQAQQFPAGVPAGSGDRHPDSHAPSLILMKKYAWL